MHASEQAAILIIGGMHASSRTTSLLLTATADGVLNRIPILFYPQAVSLAVLSPYHLRQWLDHHPRLQGQHQGSVNLLIWAFSAGCIGASGLAHYWHQHRGRVLALFACDGWGVPLVSSFPIYRLSHDHFTHVTSQWLGAGTVGFYADPPVPHLDLWSQPATTRGWQITTLPGGTLCRQRQSVAGFLCHWSRQSLIAPADGYHSAPFDT